MGQPDPRLNATGALDMRLQRLLARYAKDDDPPKRVKPIPLPLLRHLCHQQRLAVHPSGPATTDMLTLGFSFLLRPGEYAKTSSPDSTPFRLKDAHLFINQTRLPHLTCPPHDLQAASFVCLEFTSQKNGVRGALIGHSWSGNPDFCPVQAIVDQVLHLRQFCAPPTALSTNIWPTIGKPSQPRISPTHFVKPPQLWAWRSASHPATFRYAPFAHPVPQPFCVPMSTQIGSVYLAAGALMKCYGTSMSRHSLL